MKIAILIISLTLVGVLTAGCASPTVVESKQAHDSEKSCAALKTAYTEAKNFETKARNERGVTGTNVAAALLFWPAMIGTYANTGEAIDAAKERQNHLVSLAGKKKCPDLY